MTCHLGDFEEYAALRRALKDREAHVARSGAALRRATSTQSLEALKIGDVIQVPAGRNAGLAVVLDPGISGDADPRPTVLTAERQVRRLSVTDFPSPVEALEHMRIPKSFNARSPQSRRDLAAALRTRVPDAPTRNAPARPTRRGGRRGHPAAYGHPAAPLPRLRRAREPRPLGREVSPAGCARPSRSGSVWSLGRTRSPGSSTGSARCSTSSAISTATRSPTTGHASPGSTPSWTSLAAECLRQGLWEGLAPAELAACLSTLVFESRHADDASAAAAAQGRVREVLADMVRDLGSLDALERDHRLSFLREPDLGFAWAAWRWATGARLETVLTEVDLGAGDFVRWTRQLLDLLDQLANASSGLPSYVGAGGSGCLAERRSGLLVGGLIGGPYGVCVDELETEDAEDIEPLAPKERLGLLIFGIIALVCVIVAATLVVLSLTDKSTSAAPVGISGTPGAWTAGPNAPGRTDGFVLMAGSQVIAGPKGSAGLDPWTVYVYDIVKRTWKTYPGPIGVA